MLTLICQNCLQPNPDVALVCRYCGHALKPGVAAPRPTDYAPPRGSYTPTHGWASSAPLPPQPPVVAQPAPSPAVAPADFRCPYCHTNAPPVVSTRISTGGWIVFAALLIACFPLCFIGLFIKEEYRRCSWCHAPLP
ncbi:MAG: LITAF-like zinc ribbon domain-containing protein [Acidobacteria bacterium]|nr:LITAF-like zinc ribbon domain-containing protein [Acidobacteriota bacterium]